MAKKIDDKHILHFELDRLENKVKEFQDYLESNSIKGKDLNKIENDYQDKLHKEILVQIKMQDALFSWLPLLAKLRETEKANEITTRGDVEINGLFKNKLNGQ